MASKVEIILSATDAASSVLGKITGAMGDLGSSVSNIAKGFLLGGIVGKGLDLITSGISSVESAMIGGNAEFERYESQFGILLKSSDKAKERLGALAEFGANTPFELPELVRADKVLIAFGLHSDTTAKKFGVSGEQILTTIGDIAAGTGANFEELSGTFGKFASGATGDAIARFQELGIATKEEMASWGLEFSKSGQLLTPTAEAFTVLESHVRSKFGSMMNSQSSTFEGMVSNLQDWFGQVGRILGKPIFEALKTQLGGLLTVLGSPEVKGAIAGFATGIATGITQTIAAFQQFSFIAGPVLLGIVDLLTNAEDGGNTFLYALERITGSKLPNWLIDATFNLRDLWFSLLAVGNAGGPVNEFLAAASSSFLQFSSSIYTSIQQSMPVLMGIGVSVQSIFGSLIPLALAQGMGAWTLISTTIQTVITAAITIIQTWLPVVQTVLAGIAAFLAQHGIEIQLLVTTAWNTVTTIIKVAIETVTTIINALAPVVLAIFGTISTFLNSHGSEILATLTNSWSGIRVIVETVAELIKVIAVRVFGAIASFIILHGDTIQTSLSGAWKLISTVVSSTLDIIKGVVTAALAIVNGDWGTAWKAIESITEASNKLIGSIIDTAMGVIKLAISGAVDAFQLSWRNAWDEMERLADMAWTAIKLAVANGMLALLIAIDSGVKSLIGKFNDLKDRMSVIGNQLMEGLVQGIRDKVGWLVDEGIRAANMVLSAIKNTLGIHSPSDETDDDGMNLMKGGGQGVYNNADLWIGPATTVATDLISVFDNGMNTIEESTRLSFIRIAETTTPILSMVDVSTSAFDTLITRAALMSQSITTSMQNTSAAISTTANQMAQFVSSGGIGGITGGIYTPSQAFQDSFRNQPASLAGVQDVIDRIVQPVEDTRHDALIRIRDMSSISLIPALPRPSSVEKPNVENNVNIELVFNGNIDRRAATDGVGIALRQAGLGVTT